MGPELYGAGGGGSARSIGDMVIKHVSAPASELEGLTVADGRVMPVAGNEELAEVLAPQYAMPVTNFERVFAVSVWATAYFNGHWYAHNHAGSTMRIYRSATGAVGTWNEVFVATPGSGSNSDFAVLGGKIYLFFRNSTTAAVLYESADGLSWSSAGKAASAGLLGAGGSSATVARMKAINGKLVLFGSATRGGTSNVDYIAFSTDAGATFTLSASEVPVPVNNMVQSGDKIVALHNNGRIQTAGALQAAGGWTERATGVTEALYGATTTDDGVLHVVGALGRTLYSVDRVNFYKGPSIDGVTTPVRMLRVRDMDVVIASSSALDDNRRINVSSDFVNWRSEKPIGQALGTHTTICSDGSRVAVGGSNGIDMTATPSFDPVTEFPLTRFNAGPDHIAYIVTG